MRASAWVAVLVSATALLGAPAFAAPKRAEPKPKADPKPDPKPEPRVESKPDPQPESKPYVGELGPNLRIGLALDLFGESSRVAGEQRIDASRRDESFDYGSATFVSATTWLMFRRGERFSLGPGVRLYGLYSSNDRDFLFGLLTDAFLAAEYNIPVAPKWEVLFGGRVGLSVLFPGGDLVTEINRLRNEGADVWNVPRVGYLGGIHGGARWRVFERLSLRADLKGQYGQMFIFATDQNVQVVVGDVENTYRFRKSWSTYSLRLGLTLGVELAF